MLKRLFIRTSLIFFGLVGLATALPAAADYIWIEQDDAHQSRLYFGEYLKEREKSPGRLDEIKEPQAWLLDAGGKRQALKVTWQASHFHLGVAQNKTLPVIAEVLGYEVKDWTKHGHGIVKPMFYARFSPLPVRTTGGPELTLDILPISSDGSTSNAVTVYFRNAPLAKAKLKAYAPNFSIQEYSTDENGKLSIQTPWAGQYVLEVIHLEKQPGEFQGKKFEAIRHRATLTFNIPAAAQDK